MSVELNKNWLKELPDKALSQVERIASSRLLASGTVLFREGQVGAAVHWLRSGSVELSKELPDGSPAIVRYVEPDEVFAEVILFEQRKYPVTARAVRESVVTTIPRVEFVALLENPDFRLPFIALLMRKQRYLAEQIRLLRNPDAEQRLVLFLRGQLGRKREGQISLTKRAVAQAISVQPETVSRLLKRLKKKGQMEWKGNRVRLGTRTSD